MANVTIDGTNISVDDGVTILNAAQLLDIDIPTFCYQEKLAPIAACRICLVEIEGQKKLQPSCATPVMDGMVIYTRSERVEEARKGMLEIILANHPLDCPTCDKGGECELQDMVFDYGVKQGRYEETKRVFHTEDYVISPAIIKNSNRCIHCERCVRVCSEVVGAGVLGINWRGAATEETSFMRDTLECDQCGNCIEVCPVGSLMSLPYRYKARPWDLQEVDTICPFCSTGCSITVGLRDGALARVVANRKIGLNDENLCVRGRFGLDFTLGDNRIKRPHIRKDGTLVPVSWKEALQYLYENLKDNLNNDNLETAGLISARLSNEELYSFQKMMRTLFKTNNIDSSVSMGDKAAYEVIGEIFPHWSLSSSVEEVLKADTILIFGAKTDDENPVTDYIIRRTLTTEPRNLLIAHPRPLRLDEIARKTVRYIPGSEAYVSASLLKELLNLSSNQKEIKDNLINVAELDKQLTSLTAENSLLTETVETGVKDLARALFDAQKVSFIIGIDLFKAGGAAVKNLANSALLLEACKKEIVAVHPLFDRSNQRGAWDMGCLPNYLPGYKKVSDDETKREFEGVWGGEIPSKDGKDIHGIIELASADKLGTLYVVGEDVVGAYPDRRMVAEALGKIKLLIVQDNVMTETVKAAHVVLPSQSFLENEGTVTNSEGRVQRLRKVFNTPFDAERNLSIFTNILMMFNGSEISKSAEAVFQEITEVVPSYNGLHYGSVGEENTFCKSDGSGRFNRFYIPDQLPPLKGNEKEFPFFLQSGNHLYHSDVITQEVDFLRDLLYEPFIELAAKDAGSLGLNNGDKVKVSGENGGEVVLKLKVNTLFPERIAFIPDNFKEARVNNLFSGKAVLRRVKISKI
jgi:NADH-quinone oxidoreductase subunit G